MIDVEAVSFSREEIEKILQLLGNAKAADVYHVLKIIDQKVESSVLDKKENAE